MSARKKVDVVMHYIYSPTHNNNSAKHSHGIKLTISFNTSFAIAEDWAAIVRVIVQHANHCSTKTRT